MEREQFAHELIELISSAEKLCAYKGRHHLGEPMYTLEHYRRQAAAFRILAQEETNAEVKLLFQELAEGYQMQADRASEPAPVTAVDAKLVA
jgi:hypothetical protein